MNRFAFFLIFFNHSFFLFIYFLNHDLKVFSFFCREFKKLILGNSMFSFIHKILIWSQFPLVYHSLKAPFLSFEYIELHFYSSLFSGSLNSQQHFFFTNIIHFLYKIYKIKTSTYSVLEFMAVRVPQRLSFKKRGGRKHWQESPMQSNSFFLENCGY